MDRLKKAADQESQQKKQDKCKRKQDQTCHKGNFSREGLACQLREPQCGILHIPEGDIDGDHQADNCQNLSDYTVSETENREKYQRRQYTEVQQRSEEHTSELQSRGHLVCRLMLETKQPTTFSISAAH